MPRIPSEDEEDEIANQEDDRAESAEEVQGGKPAPAAEKPVARVVQYDDQGARQASGTMPHSLTYEPRPVRSLEDLDPKVAEHLKAAAKATKARLAALDDEEQETAAPASPAAAKPVDPPAQPGAQTPAPPAPEQPKPAEPPAGAAAAPALDPNLVKGYELLNSERATFDARVKEWETSTGEQQKKLSAVLDKFDWDPVGALRDIAALRLQTEDASKIDAQLDEVYDDLAGHRLKIEADEGKKAKREARRTRSEWARYQQEQRADAERVKREADASRTRAEAERETSSISTWFAGTPKTSHEWLRTHEDPGGLIRDVKREFQKHGQTINDDQAAAFADNQLKEYAQAHFNRFKHLLAPDQKPATAPAAPAAVEGAVKAQVTQPATPPPANSQRTRDLTNTATVTTPTTPPPPTKPFDPNEDADDARRRSLSKWAAKRKAQQQQQ